MRFNTFNAVILAQLLWLGKSKQPELRLYLSFSFGLAFDFSQCNILTTSFFNVGIRVNDEVNAFHLYSPPLLMRLDSESQIAHNFAYENANIDIYVSEEDSEITIQKDKNKPVVYFLKTTPAG